MISAQVAFDFSGLNQMIEPLRNGQNGEHGASHAPQMARADTSDLVPVDERALAIVGMACRLPRAADLAGYRELLRSGGEAVVEVPPERWDAAGFLETDADSRHFVSRWASLLDNVEAFDGQFFGIRPREVIQMDPQQRLLLEVAHEAISHAGWSAPRLAGTRTGVFVGIGNRDYTIRQMRLPDHYRSIGAYSGSGNANSLAANRLSYIFDLRGPSMAIDTACSSSLTALVLACTSLRHGECDAALVGGVNILLTPEVTISFTKARLLSTTGHCRPFDSEADGYVRGEGCGIVVVKRLADALRDRDRILALVRGAAINQAGRTRGITAPSCSAQVDVIRSALRDARLPADLVSYVEAHGTGTPLGDSVEFSALCQVFNDEHKGPCHFGSVKGNLGHLEFASGVASLIKVLLMIEDRQLYPQINFRSFNPQIRLDESRLRLVSTSQDWTPIEGRRLAGINSFGFGGANAHVIVESPPAIDECETANRPPLHVLSFSARSDASLAQLAARYAAHASRAGETIGDLCATANANECRYPNRLVAVGATADELAQRLQTFAQQGKCPQVSVGHAASDERPRVAFLFSGQGSQYPGMAAELYRTHAEFRAALDECDAVLSGELGGSLVDVLIAPPPHCEEIHETSWAQPALFAVEYSLTRLWAAWGVLPDALLGHGTGEYVAACVAGAISLDDALRLVARRALLLNALPQNGMMAAVRASEATSRRMLDECASEVALAAINGPKNVVISGGQLAVEHVLARFESAGIVAQPLRVSHAFHSPLLDPALEQLEELAAGFSFRAPRLPLVSNLTGQVFENGQAPAAAYFRRHAREAVRFADGVQALRSLGCRIFLEIGPGTTLSALGRHCIAKAEWLPSLRPGGDDWRVLLESLGRMYTRGVEVNWERVSGPIRRRVPLPSYPFERKRFWLEPPAKTNLGRRGGANGDLHALLGERVLVAIPATLHESEVGSRQPAYLDDCRTHGIVRFPAAAFIETALAAAATQGEPPWLLEDVSLHQPLSLEKDQKYVLQFVRQPPAGGRTVFTAFSRVAAARAYSADDAWTPRAAGTIVAGDPPAARQRQFNLIGLRACCPELLDLPQHYQVLARHGLQYGPAFQLLEHLSRGARQALGHVVAKGKIRPDRYLLHPAVLDACFQVLATAFSADALASGAWIVTKVRSVRLIERPSGPIWAYATAVLVDIDEANPRLVGELLLLDDRGRVVAEFEGVELGPLVGPTGG